MAKHTDVQNKGTARAARLQVKELDEDARTFEGLASTWEQDLGDDIIHRGAFKETLEEWEKSGRALPLIDQHHYDSIRSVVGKLLEAKETSEGLQTKWEVIGGPDGDEVLRRLRDGYVDGLSIGYMPKNWDYEEDDNARFGEVRHIRKLDLREVSLVVFPMNEGARVDLESVKRMPVGLRKQLRDALDDVDESADKGTEGGDKGVAAPDMNDYVNLRLRRLGLGAQK